jgi:hypothetical protein
LGQVMDASLHVSSVLMVELQHFLKHGFWSEAAGGAV